MTPGENARRYQKLRQPELRFRLTAQVPESLCCVTNLGTVIAHQPGARFLMRFLPAWIQIPLLAVTSLLAVTAPRPAADNPVRPVTLVVRLLPAGQATYLPALSARRWSNCSA